MDEATKNDDNGEEKRPQFGQRFLQDPRDVFKHNAWDSVSWDERQELDAANKVEQNSSELVSRELREQYEKLACQYWNDFYSIHGNKFFKDRHWLFTEFPELNLPAEPVKDGKKIVLEIGCGVGNTVFPILDLNRNNVFVYCCDFSERAVQLVKEHPEFDPTNCQPFVCDVSSDWNPPFSENSLDIVLLVFTLSAINPNKMLHVAKQIYRYLKPGGLLLFRDYGRYDLVQLRFKKGQCLSQNFYVRGDGTRAYFFTEGELRNLFESANFIEVSNVVDRRLQVNRGKFLKMYRIWLQAKYRKPS